MRNLQRTGAPREFAEITRRSLRREPSRSFTQPAVSLKEGLRSRGPEERESHIVTVSSETFLRSPQGGLGIVSESLHDSTSSSTRGPNSLRTSLRVRPSAG